MYCIMKLKDLQKGDYFLCSSDLHVYILGSFIRALDEFSCYPFDDVHRETFLNAHTDVFPVFEF